MMLHLFLEKQEQTESKISRQKEIIKIRAEINEIKTKKYYKDSTQKRFFEMINKIDTFLAKIPKEGRKRPKLSFPS
jgi:hypothetical protein